MPKDDTHMTKKPGLITKDLLLSYLEKSFKSAFCNHHCDREHTCEMDHQFDNQVMTHLIEQFFREAMSLYRFEALLDQFTPPEKGITLFFDYVQTHIDGGTPANLLH
jgi:hypothetical protein